MLYALHEATYYGASPMRAAALPNAGIEVLAVTFAREALTAAPSRMPLSRSPDRTLRPPIIL